MRGKWGYKCPWSRETAQLDYAQGKAALVRKSGGDKHGLGTGRHEGTGPDEEAWRLGRSHVMCSARH